MTKPSDAKRTRIAMEKHQREIDEGVLMTIVDQKENWSECTLEDGTKLRIRPVITEVRKSRKLGPDGKPSYGIKTALVTDTQHADKPKKAG